MNYDLIKNIDGWCSQEKMTKMYNLIIDTNPSCLVEIGVFGGKSLLVQAFGLRENQKGIIHGIDSWNIKDCLSGMKLEEHINWWSNLDYEKIYNGCIRAIEENKMEKYIELHKMTSEEYSKIIDFEIDILHIDGNHEEESSCKDVELYVPKVKHGGYIWFDDIGWKQTEKAVNLLETKYKCKLIDSAMSDDLNNWCNLYQKI